MKILIINGSAHKGNTWKLAKKAIEEISRLDKKAGRIKSMTVTYKK